jgi:hypothetical protein
MEEIMKQQIGLLTRPANEVSHMLPSARPSTVLFLALTLAFLFSAFRAGADNGRDFAGMYNLVDTTDLGEQIRFEFRLRVFNYSGTDLSNATITLQDSFVPGSVYWSVDDVSIAPNESTVLTQTVTVPKREYDQWQQGGQPNVTIRFRDSKNQNRKQRVELLRQPGI